jgi:uncharacterized protein YuzE
MRLPIVIEVRDGAGYIRYRNDEAAETIDLMASCSVAADVNEDREVIGIEILDVASPGQLEAAHRFARERGLGFPRDLTGALVETYATA